MNTLDLAEKVALVTGGSRGIGLAIARALSANGANTFIVARKQDALIEAARAISKDCGWYSCDIGKTSAAADAIGSCINRFGRLDILVNNASTNNHFGPVMDISQQQAEKVALVNQWSMVAWSQQAWLSWMKDNGGRIINITSIGAFHIEPGIGWYNGTKAAVGQLTREMALELGPSVTVNAIAPGVVKTEMSRIFWEKHEERLSSRVPLGRLGIPSDIAEAAVFLVSDMAAYITGQTLTVDGGITLGIGVSG